MASNDAINGMKARQEELKALMTNPLSAPGNAETLRSVQGALQRRRESQLGQLQGRAALTGQAGFAGQFGAAARDAYASEASDYADAQAKLALDTANQARQLDVTLLGQEAQAEAAANSNETARYGIDTTASTQRYGIDTNKGLEQQKIDISKKTAQTAGDLEEEKLAENKRQFDVSGARTDKQNKVTNQQNDTRLQQGQTALDQAQTGLDLKTQEANFQKLKELLAIGMQGAGIGLVSPNTVSGQLNALGVPSSPQSYGNLRPDIAKFAKAGLSPAGMNRG